MTIVLLGIIALTTLSVEQYPDIAPPTVQVTTSYPGANAETVQKAVIVPLEEAINGVENMSYIHSESLQHGRGDGERLFPSGRRCRHGRRERAEPRVEGTGACCPPR